MWKVLTIDNYSFEGREIDTPVIWNIDELRVEPIPSLWLLSLRGSSGDSLNTASAYASTLCLLVNEIGRDPNIADWTEMNEKRMYAFLEYKLSKERNLSGNTIEQYIARLKQFYSWAYNEGWLSSRPNFSWRLSEETQLEIAKKKGVKNSYDPFGLTSQYISQEEFRELLGFKSASKTFEMERDDLILKMGYYSGFRASETIDPYNVDVNRIGEAINEAESDGRVGFWLDIIGKGKNGGKVRTVYFPDQLKSQIQQFIKSTWTDTVPRGTKALICKRNGEQIQNQKHASKLFSKSVSNLIGGAESSTKIGWVKNSDRSFHSLRHSYATNLADYCKQQGESYVLVQDRMGHSDFSTTKIYIHFNAILRNDKETADEMASQLPQYMNSFLEGDS